jgi:uncharacterized coiled-coil protein SlyX
VADQIDVGPPPVQLTGGRSRKGIVLATLLVILGAAAVFGWLSFGDELAELGFFAKAPGSTASMGVGDSVAATEFTAFQAQTSASLQSATQLLNAQQAELKRLSEQLAGLNARIDGLQSTVAAAAPAPSASGVPPVGTPQAAAASPAAAAPRPTAPRKRPAQPAGAISVGGAPLPGAAPRP